MIYYSHIIQNIQWDMNIPIKSIILQKLKKWMKDL